MVNGIMTARVDVKSNKILKAIEDHYVVNEKMKDYT